MNKNQILEFGKGITLLINLNSQTIDLQSAVKEELQYFKNNNIPIIGNPLNKIFNELIKLNYCSLQLIDNCKIYKDLIDNDIFVDHTFLLQLSGLLFEIEKMQYTYDIILDSFGDCEHNFYFKYAN